MSISALLQLPVAAGFDLKSPSKGLSKAKCALISHCMLWDKSAKEIKSKSRFFSLASSFFAALQYTVPEHISLCFKMY